MKILLSSYSFSPNVGGIETTSLLLAKAFADAGHDVVVVTMTAEDDGVTRNYSVVRNPGLGKMFNLVRWCDIFYQNNISLNLVWPRLFIRRPLVVTHQTWTSLVAMHFSDWKSGLKEQVVRLAINVCPSQALAKSLPVDSQIIPNPYRDDLFRILPGMARTKELVYLGRLVSDKGVDLLISALGLLRQRDLFPRLTIIGKGPDEILLRELALKQGVVDQVDFVGVKKGEDLVQVLNEHQVLVVPSRWAEPFGIVALEGLACGCTVVGSEAGGLPEAIGLCGLTFPNGDGAALADRLESVLTQPGLRATLLSDVEKHLESCRIGHVAERYLQLFTESLSK